MIWDYHVVSGAEHPGSVETCNRYSCAKPRACHVCGKVLMAAAGFIETIAQPDGRRRDFCSRRCLREHLTEDET